MTASEGILTAFGGMTSHAAVVARQLGTCCVSGCKEIVIDEPRKDAHLHRRHRSSRRRLDES